MASTSSPAPPVTTEGTAQSQPFPPQHENEEEELEIDNSDDTDSAFSGGGGSETTSLTSAHYKGYWELGRRYQTTTETEYSQPSDEKQWESASAGHLLMLILDSQRSNTLFRSPVSSKWQNILDLGTGNGDWAVDVADTYPGMTVRGVDLFPPPHKWTAPNCIFEVDDILKDWTWDAKFDLVHLRHMSGAFGRREWQTLYRHIYDNLQPGGWIEQVDIDNEIFSMDGSLPKDAAINFGRMFHDIGEKIDKSFDTIECMEDRIKAAGFTNVQATDYRVPLGTWSKQQVYKDAGRVAKTQLLQGMEGWTTYLLTRHGLPTPWSPEEVQVWLANVRQEADKGYRIYQKYKRVWAQKPYDAEPKPEQKIEVVDVATKSPSPASPAQKKQRTGSGGEAAST